MEQFEWFFRIVFAWAGGTVLAALILWGLCIALVIVCTGGLYIFRKMMAMMFSEYGKAKEQLAEAVQENKN